MSLIVCTECGKEYSNKALSCPQCGCPTESNQVNETIRSDISEEEKMEGSYKEEFFDKPQEEINDEEQMPSNSLFRRLKSKKTIRLATVILGVIVLLLAASMFFYSNSNYNAGQEAMKKQEYQIALQKFSHSFHSGSKDNIKLAEQLITSKEEFQKGEDIWSIGFADALTDNAKMEEALKHYSNVIPKDKNYKAAQAAMSEIKNFMVLMENREKAIDLTKKSKALSDYKTTEDVINSWINDTNEIYTVYGWEAVYARKISPVLTESANDKTEELDKSLFFVSFEFDDDSNRENGCRLYGFEVNIESGTVLYILNSSTLEKKYRDWGFIE